jgi:hypothetical protein
MNKSRRIRWAGYVKRMGEKRNASRLFVGKPEGKRRLEQSRCRWVDNIVIYPEGRGCSDIDWINLD